MALNIFDDGGGTGKYNLAGNWSLDHVPIAGEDILIAAACSLEDFDQSAVALAGMSISAGLRLTIANGGRLKITNFDADADATRIRFTGNGELECTGTLVSGGGVGVKIEAVSATGKLTVAGNIVAGLWLEFDLQGASVGSEFTIDLATNIISISCGGQLSLQHDFEFVKILNGGNGSLSFTEAAFKVKNCTFVSCYANSLWLSYCDARHVQIEHNTFEANDAANRYAIYVISCQDIRIVDCWIYGQGIGFEVRYASVVMVGGGIGYKSDGTVSQRTKIVKVNLGASFALLGCATNFSSVLIGYIGGGSKVTLLGEKTWGGSAFSTDWSKHEVYVENTGDSAEKMESGTGGTVTINLDDDNYHAPTTYVPWIVRGVVRVKGGNTPSLSVDYNLNVAAAALWPSLFLVLDPGGALTGAEASDTPGASGRTGTLTATLAGALDGTDEFDLPFEIRCTDNINNGEVEFTNLVPANTGVNDMNMEFAPSLDGFHAVLAAAGGIAGKGIMTGGRM